MATPKYKHFKFEDRYTIQEFLRFGYSFTAIAKRLGKDRRAVSKEVLKHRLLKPGQNKSKLECPSVTRPPYVCNGCPERTSCRMNQYIYEASIAQNEYQKTLRQQRMGLHISNEQIAAINDTIAPLMIHKHHSVNHVYAAHPDVLPMSKSTFYRYVDLGILDVRNIDLARKVKYNVKKEYDDSYTRSLDKSYKFGRFYRDFQDYMEYNSPASFRSSSRITGPSSRIRTASSCPQRTETDYPSSFTVTRIARGKRDASKRTMNTSDTSSPKGHPLPGSRKKTPTSLHPTSTAFQDFP